MCLSCHHETDLAPERAEAHGDGNPECVRRFVWPASTILQHAEGSSYIDPNGGYGYHCVDCGENVRAMDSDDHCCYTDG